MQAFGGGSLEFPALAAARGRRHEVLERSDIPDGGDEPVEIPIEDALDLHAFAPRDVASVVEDYLTAAHARGFREVRLIHGRGIGVQREIVRAALARHVLVESFADAPPERGGWGATVVQLRIPAR